MEHIAKYLESTANKYKEESLATAYGLQYLNATDAEAAIFVVTLLEMYGTHRQSFVQIYFESNTISQNNISQAIDSGYPVMAFYEVGKIGNTIVGHEVFITGYNDVTSTNSQATVQYFDPETGRYATATPDKFLNALKVTGLK